MRSSVRSSLVLRDADDWHLLFGIPPTSNDVQSACTALPEGADRLRKHVFGLFDGAALVTYLGAVAEQPRGEARARPDCGEQGWFLQ